MAKGWHRKHDQASAAAAAPVREHSKEHGRSSDHHRGTPPSQERTQFAPTTAPQPAGEATRHDNGKHGGWDGRGNHGDHGHDHEGHGSGGHK